MILLSPSKKDGDFFNTFFFIYFSRKKKQKRELLTLEKYILTRGEDPAHQKDLFILLCTMYLVQS